MIKKSNTKWRPGQALRVVCQLAPWILVSLLLVVAFGQADSAALAGLFQSPPTDTPTAEALPTLPPTLEVAPTLTPTLEATATLPPTSTPLPTETPTLEPSPEPSQTPSITGTLPIDAGGVEIGSTANDRYPDEGSNLEFEWGMLFDSMALGLSYVWLCCGAVFMLLLPAFFLALWVAARRRRRRME